MSNAYRIRLQRKLDRGARTAQQRREDGYAHGDAVIQRWLKACEECYGPDHGRDLQYRQATGWYYVVIGKNKEALRESDVEKSIARMYAAAHERELTANIPSEDI